MGRRYRIFLDANILFSAANTGSNMASFLGFLAENHYLVTSDYAAQEAERNIHAKRPQWLEAYHKLMPKIERINGIDRELKVQIAAKDRPILASAIQSGCDFLLTGDKKDFGHLFGQSLENTMVASPLILVEELVNLSAES